MGATCIRVDTISSTQSRRAHAARTCILATSIDRHHVGEIAVEWGQDHVQRSIHGARRVCEVHVETPVEHSSIGFGLVGGVHATAERVAPFCARTCAYFGLRVETHAIFACRVCTRGRCSTRAWWTCVRGACNCRAEFESIRSATIVDAATIKACCIDRCAPRRRTCDARTVSRDDYAQSEGRGKAQSRRSLRNDEAVRIAKNDLHEHVLILFQLQRRDASLRHKAHGARDWERSRPEWNGALVASVVPKHRDLSGREFNSRNEVRLQIDDQLRIRTACRKDEYGERRG